jgi:quercetin dioxygenase-like cupin family protein
MLAVSFPVLLAGPGQAQDAGASPIGQNMDEMKFHTPPGLPTCAVASVPSGDPAKEAAFILVKAAAKCAIPWHWHTANEYVMMINGTARLDMKDTKSFTVRTGGFAKLPAKHVHQFLCTAKSCTFYIYTDAAFDIHYVDGQGKEITPPEALKAVKETAAK